jgi:putative membrane protein
MTRSAFAIAITTVLFSSIAIEQMAHAQGPSTQPTAQQQSHQDGVSTSGESQADNPKHDVVTRLDEKFLKNFAQINAAEIGKSELAAWKAEYAEVKAFATHMVDVHSKMIGKVETIAVQINVDVNAKPDFVQKTKSAILNINAGASFDRAFMKAMVNDHEEIIAMLETEIKDGRDASVKQLASAALADAQQHLQMAQELRAKISDEQNAKLTLAQSKSSSPQKLATGH